MSTNAPRRRAATSSSVQRPTMVQRAGRSAGRAAGKVAYNTMYAGATQAASLYRSIVAPLFSWFFGLLRGVTSFQASVTGCLAVVALVIALAGLGGLGMLGVARNLAYVKADIARPLDFDYSQPIAIASVSLREPPPSLGIFTRFSRLLGYVLRSSDAHHADHHGKSTADSHGAYNERQPAPYDPAAAMYYANHKAATERTLVRRAALGSPDGTDRPLPVGQSVSVLVDLDLPADHTDLFQVTVELQGEAGLQLARMSRSYMPPRMSAVTQMIRLPFMLPWQLLGWTPTRHVKLQLIEKYVEQMSPVVQARVLLASRNASMGALPPPAVYKGTLHVILRLGVGRWLLYWICPSWPTTVVLGAFAITTSVTAGSIALLLMILTIVLHRLSGGSRQAQPTTNIAGLHPAAVQQLRQLLLTGSFHARESGGGRGGRQALPAGKQTATGVTRPVQLIDYQDAGGALTEDGSEFDHEEHYHDDDEHDEYDGYDADSLASGAHHEEEQHHLEGDEEVSEHVEPEVQPRPRQARPAASSQRVVTATAADRQVRQQVGREAVREVEPAGEEVGGEEEEVGLKTPGVETPPREPSTDAASSRNKQRSTESLSGPKGTAKGSADKLSEVPSKAGAVEIGTEALPEAREGSLVDALTRAAAAAEPEAAQDREGGTAESSGGLFAALQQQVRQRPAARAATAGRS